MLQKYHVILAVGAFIVSEKKEILVVRKSPFEKIDGGLWTVPGGKINPDEAILDGLKREVMEEVGLEISPLGWIGEDVFESSGFFYHAQHFLCKPTSSGVKLEKKLLEYRWIKKAGIETLEFPTNIKSRIMQTL